MALTDSFATPIYQLKTPEQREWMWKNAVHFVASTKPVGEVLGDNKKTDVCVIKSAGHNKHEYTTGYAFEEILKHFEFK
jgi:hypothetical protein